MYLYIYWLYISPGLVSIYIYVCCFSINPDITQNINKTGVWKWDKDDVVVFTASGGDVPGEYENWYVIFTL